MQSILFVRIVFPTIDSSTGAPSVLRVVMRITNELRLYVETPIETLILRL